PEVAVAPAPPAADPRVKLPLTISVAPAPKVAFELTLIVPTPASLIARGWKPAIMVATLNTPESNVSRPVQCAVPVLLPPVARPTYIVPTSALIVPPEKSAVPLGALEAPVCARASPIVHQVTGLIPSLPRK